MCSCEIKKPKKKFTKNFYKKKTNGHLFVSEFRRFNSSSYATPSDAIAAARRLWKYTTVEVQNIWRDISDELQLQCVNEWVWRPLTFWLRLLVLTCLWQNRRWFNTSQCRRKSMDIHWMHLLQPTTLLKLLTGWLIYGLADKLKLLKWYVGCEYLKPESYEVLTAQNCSTLCQLTTL